MTDTQAFDKALFDALTGRQELTDLIAAGKGDYGPGVYPEAIPHDADLRAVVYDLILGTPDVNPQEGQRQMSFATAIVRCASAGRKYPDDVAEQIDLALGGAAGLSVTVGGFHIHVARVSAFRMPGGSDENPVRFAGGRYRLTASHPL